MLFKTFTDCMGVQCMDELIEAEEEISIMEKTINTLTHKFTGLSGVLR